MSSSVPLLEPPLKMSSTTNSKNHNKNKYNEQTTSLGDNVVTYCPNEDLSKQCAFAFEQNESDAKRIDAVAIVTIFAVND